MTQPNDGLISHLSALKDLRDAEGRLGIEPLQRREGCPQPSELIAVAQGTAAPEAGEQARRHAADCPSCRAALEAFRSALADLPEEDEPGPASGADTPTGRNTGVGYTQLFRDPATRPALLGRLWRWLPHLLRQVGLPAELAEDVLHLVQSRLAGLGPRERFSPALLGWVGEFAHGRGLEARPLTEEAIRAAVEAAELEQVLSHADPHETPELARFREAARRQCRDLRDFIAFAPEGLPADDCAGYQEQLLVEAEERASRELADVLA
jgi:hypothetical protein